ncbi:hypothetical protein SCHPADRAFT_898841 [Schizopora paradoxa]|uniref:Uncharacterized protein n=1 Tax=Schizopora paradoxa TaxID=27342 RepID=A0A0H2SCU5_9AGAM|nr:hypothetical protein SCHPADRAFT_898841 [Schizopora paradoxa]
MVGANYRRIQLPEAAVQVYTVMLEVMRTRGYGNSDLKPAFLALAQCNYDIAKRRVKNDRSLDTEEAAHERFLSTLEWLRQTYGTNSGSKSPKPRIPTGPRKRDASCMESDGAELRYFKDGFVRSNEVYASSSPNYKRIQVLQSELNVLRSSQITSASMLESTKQARRAAEDELASQRVKFRRLENRLADLEDDFDAARRATKKFEEKALQEEHARRRAEENLAEERRAWVKRECVVREEAAKAVLSDLASVFARAAQAPSTMWNGIGGINGDGGALLGKRP